MNLTLTRRRGAALCTVTSNRATSTETGMHLRAADGLEQGRELLGVHRGDRLHVTLHHSEANQSGNARPRNRETALKTPRKSSELMSHSLIDLVMTTPLGLVSA